VVVVVGFNGIVPPGKASAISFVGTGSEQAGALADALGAADPLTAPPPPELGTWSWDFAERLDAWTGELDGVPVRPGIVVCTWAAAPRAEPLSELEPREWRRRVEWPSALWFSTLVAAAARCEDGGSLVAVADRPATLDAIGHGAEVVVAEAVANVIRSLAAREGGRGVRVNAVFSALHTPASDLPGSPPPLATFPGTVRDEVAGAVRMLLSDDAVGVTGTVVSATGGRR
jgi:NAD(P)-dependent dehydrogenase (short-subunit alcohol dehydrogenase family)